MHSIRCTSWENSLSSLQSTIPFRATLAALSGDAGSENVRFIFFLFEIAPLPDETRIVYYVWENCDAHFGAAIPPLPAPVAFRLNWIAEIAVELSGSLRRRCGNLGSAGSLIFLTLMRRLLLVALRCKKMLLELRWAVREAETFTRS